SVPSQDPGHDPLQLGHCWHRHLQHLVETSPYCRVQRTGMVCGGDEQGRPNVTFHHLEDSVDHPAKLAVIGRVPSLLTHGVKLVEEQHDSLMCSIVEHTAQIAAGLSQVSRHDAVDTDWSQWHAQFSG